MYIEIIVFFLFLFYDDGFSLHLGTDWLLFADDSVGLFFDHVEKRGDWLVDFALRLLRRIDEFVEFFPDDEKLLNFLCFDTQDKISDFKCQSIVGRLLTI